MSGNDGHARAQPGVPWLSIIVLGYNRFEATSRLCLDSLDLANLHPDVEVILIDNGSSDDSAALSAEYCRQHPRVRFIPSTVNLGFAGGMNAGVEAAGGRYVLLSNSDLVFPSAAVAALRHVLDAHPQVDILGPVTNAAGNAQALPQLGAEQADVLAGANTLQEHPTGLLHPVYRADFFCVAVKREVWQALGGLDTSFGRGYYEDFDFSLRARAAGYVLSLTEDVVIFHAGSGSFSRIGAEQRELIRRNKARLRERHPDVRFQHQRDGNLDMLREYATLLTAGRWGAGLERRLALRLAEAQHNMPRSPLKRLLWRRKLAPLMAQIHALRAALPSGNNT